MRSRAGAENSSGTQGMNQAFHSRPDPGSSGVRSGTLIPRASCSPVVLVVAPEPVRLRSLLIAPRRGAVQQEVVTHRRLQPARRAHVGAIDDAVGERVRAQARALGYVSRRVRSGRLGHLLDGRRNLALQERLELL